MDPYSSPYITHYSSFHFLIHSFIPSEPEASKPCGRSILNLLGAKKRNIYGTPRFKFGPFRRENLPEFFRQFLHQRTAAKIEPHAQGFRFRVQGGDG